MHTLVSVHFPPVAVEVVQLLLHVAAEAASVVPVQPLPHNTHAVLAFVFVKCKVLNLGGNTTAPTRMDLFRQRRWSLGRPRHILTGVRGKTGFSDLALTSARLKTSDAVPVKRPTFFTC